MKSSSQTLLAFVTISLLSSTSTFASPERPAAHDVCESPMIHTSPKHFTIEPKDQNKPWGGKFVGNVLHADGTAALTLSKASPIAVRFVAEKTGNITSIRWHAAAVPIPVPTQPPVTEGQGVPDARVTPTLGGKVVVKLIKGDGKGHPSTLPADVIAETADNNELPMGEGNPFWQFKAPAKVVANTPYFLVFYQLEDHKLIGLVTQTVADTVTTQPAPPAGEPVQPVQGQGAIRDDGTNMPRITPPLLRDGVAGPFYNAKTPIKIRQLVSLPCAPGLACPAVLTEQWQNVPGQAVGNYELTYDDGVVTGPSILSAGANPDLAIEKIGGPNRVREAFIVKDETYASGVWFRAWRTLDRATVPPVITQPAQGTTEAKREPNNNLRVIIRDAEFKALKVVSLPPCAISFKPGRKWQFAQFNGTLKLTPGKYYIVFRADKPIYETSLTQDGRALQYKSKNIPGIAETDVELGAQITTDDGKTWRGAKFKPSTATTTFDPSAHITAGMQTYQ